jgi:hypothetical protein
VLLGGPREKQSPGKELLEEWGHDKEPPQNNTQWGKGVVAASRPFTGKVIT